MRGLFYGVRSPPRQFVILKRPDVILSTPVVILSAAKDLTHPSAVQACVMLSAARHDTVTG